MATVTSYTSAHIDTLLGAKADSSAMTTALAAKADAAAMTTALAAKADLVSGKVPDSQIGTNVVRVDSLTLNVQNHGAVGDGVTDDTTAIQATLNLAPSGGTVYLPKSYAVTSPLTIPPQVRLLGQHSIHTNTITSPTIKAKSTFTGATMISMVDQTTGSYSVASTEQRIENVSIDMSAIPGATYTHGIYANGSVYGVRLREVSIYNPSGYGIHFASNASGIAASWHCERVNVISPRDHGINGTINDSTWIDCLVYGGSFSGWIVGGAANSTFDVCRAERNANNGFYFSSSDGTGTLSGGPTFTGCSTDRNANNGVYMTGAASGNGPITFIGCSFRRDGSASTSAGYAAININGTNEPVSIIGCKSYPGVDDAGTGNATPQYGIFVSNCVLVQIDGGTWHGISEGIHDGGANVRLARGLNVFERTGTTSSPTTVTRGLQTYGTNNESLDVPGNLAGTPTPASHGAVAWTADPSSISGSLAPPNGQIWMSAIYVSKPVTVTQLYWGIQTTGSTPTASANWIGIYDTSGNRLANVNIDSRVTLGGGSGFAETINVAMTPGMYWVVWLFNATTAPAVYKTNVNNLANNILNFKLSTPAKYRYAAYGSGQTTLPSTLTVASVALSSQSFWAAVG